MAGVLQDSKLNATPTKQSFYLVINGSVLQHTRDVLILGLYKTKEEAELRAASCPTTKTAANHAMPQVIYPKVVEVREGPNLIELMFANRVLDPYWGWKENYAA